MRTRTFFAWMALPASLLLLWLVLYLQSPVANAKVLRLAHVLNAGHPVHLGMQAFADELAKLSAGKLKVELYADAKLGTERELLELLQIGSVAMTKVSAGQLEAFAPEFALFSLPYLFDDGAHFWRFANSQSGQNMLVAAERFRLRGLSFYDAGARSFYFGRNMKTIVRHPDDLKGLALRVMPSQSAMAMVEAMGAKPVPIPFGELYSALDTGAVDGAENNAPSLFSSRQYEVASSYSLNQHMILPDVLIIGTPTWQRLSETERAWVQQAAAYSSVRQQEFWQISEHTSLAQMQAKGFAVHQEVDRAAFRERAQVVYQRPEFQLSEILKLQSEVARLRTSAETSIESNP
jgi:tripartite ATP-independent transporter DctP family solute receptor